MLTNPNTLGLFEEDIAEIAAAVHEVGGLLYYDGANLNAILGVVRPGDMGFDIVHMNLHKTFATPHGGGGPGAGPVAVSERLVPFLPGPRPVRVGVGRPGAGLRLGDAAAVHRSGAHLARQRPGAGPGPGLHPGQRRRRPAPDRRGGRAQRQLDPPAPDRHLRRALRPALHARGGAVGPHPQAGPRGAGPRRGQAPARGGLPLADRLLPAHRGRGADDRAHRDREPPDPRGPGRVPRAHRRRGRQPARRAGWPSSRTTRRSAGWTRPGRPAPSSPPSTPGPEPPSAVDGIFTTRFVGSVPAFPQVRLRDNPTAGSASTATGCRPCCSPPPAGSRAWPAPTGSPTAATGATSSWWPPTGGATDRRPGCSTFRPIPE